MTDVAVGKEEAELIAWLAGRADRQIDTACAHVFLAPEAALKIKRHADLGYADFSTVELRRWALDRELAFNKLAAPDIYRAVRRITREADGGLALDGFGPTIEYVLEMRRFDDSGVLANDPTCIDGGLADALGRTIAGFHAVAPLRPEGGWSAMQFTVDSNAKLLRDIADRLDPALVERMTALTAVELERQRPLLQARSAAGFARRCHGDLHLGNILVENGAPILFDCIEFNDLLSDLDVQYDLAFLLMDLDFRGRRDAAARLLAAYLDAAVRTFPGGQVCAGLAALPLMLSVRAAVRAHVSAHSGDDGMARAYVQAAIDHLAPPPPRLVAVGGFSGAGKSTFARLIAPHLGASPGAVVVRTDEARKRLAGAGPTDRLEPETYTEAFYLAVYDDVMATARGLLLAGRSVVLDATFTDPALRTRAEQLARDVAAPFEGVWLDASSDVLEGRIERREGDASDATVAVLRQQLARHQPPSVAWRLIDMSGTANDAAAAWLKTCAN